MAEESEDVTEESGGGKSNLIIFIVIGLVLIGLTIGGTLIAVKMLTPEPEPKVQLDADGNPISAEEDVKEVSKSKNPAIYFPLKPPIIVNFQARGRQRFMQVDVSLMTRENDVIEVIERHMPMLRNTLILKFGAQEYEEIQTEEGREILRQDALKDLQEIMKKEIGKPGIEKLLFTNLVLQ